MLVATRDSSSRFASWIVRSIADSSFSDSRSWAAACCCCSGVSGLLDAVTRQPVQEFAVQLIRLRREAYTEDPPLIRNFKSATGRFSWPDVAAGAWRAAISAPGYQMFNVADLQISEGTITHEIVVPLLRGFAVRGRVFELSTGAGIVGAHIGFRQVGAPDGFKSQASAESQPDGSFTLDGIPGGDIVLGVSAPDHESRQLPIVVDEKTLPQEIALSTGATIAGVVTTTAGAPAKGRVTPERTWLGLHQRNEPSRSVLVQSHVTRSLPSVGRHECRQRQARLHARPG